MEIIETAILLIAIILTLWQLVALRNRVLADEITLPVHVSVILCFGLCILIVHFSGLSPFHLLWLFPVSLVCGFVLPLFPVLSMVVTLFILLLTLTHPRESAETRLEEYGLGSQGIRKSEPGNLRKKSDICQLRNEPGVLSDKDVRDMIRKHNFYSGTNFIWIGRKWKNKSGDFENYFADNGNGTVTDRVTSLMWQKSGLDRQVTFNKAQGYIGYLNRRKFAGYRDWRLPTLEELASLLENKKANDRHIDPVFRCNGYCYWSADKREPRGVWLGLFYFGKVHWAYPDNKGHVRAVRSCRE